MGRNSLERNKIVIVGQLVYIWLQGLNAQGRYTITDLKSFNKFNLGDYVWTHDGKGDLNDTKRQGYAVAWDKEQKKSISMHRLITQNTTRLHSEHKNGHSLDNRSENLRIATAKENNRNVPVRKDNKIGYKNVSEFQGKYRCLIKFDGVKQSFGTRFDKAEQAALAYNLVMSQIEPEYTWFNEIPEGSLTQDEIEFVEKTVENCMDRNKKKYQLYVPESFKYTNKVAHGIY